APPRLMRGALTTDLKQRKCCMSANNNPQTLEWQALSSEHHLAPFSDYKQLKEKGPRIITRAEGVYLWDSEGHKILDGMSGLWCVAIGYGREELADAASK
ncbi:Aminotransferase, class III, partial [Pseudomonas syringae pv. maculicola]